MAVAESSAMASELRNMADLELALLRRGVSEMAAGCERCQECGRTPLIGERVYAYEEGIVLCELCRHVRREAPVTSHVVHGPEFGHTMRITDQRAA
jgi:hypothetical protein